MGNEHSGAADGHLFNEDEYEQLGQTNDARYGEVRILRNKTTNFLVSLIYYFKNKTQMLREENAV
jgi:hypothetical protein